ncbi:hypothetical protein KY290_033500 [Solanum tuberosum]|uniref:Uncharacterized protein n=1 Tax=Solanum tuberosum TaxID=4113 RepID=A0ABQ7U0H1_SOLTU|nr:hypothetical protein KY289_032858 [Solanum tuberosum]KAH0647504.1 hypothetical protein KY285_032752 [Solanum tuberosum]KAH0740457.1 hypothetical protein KY290_033500 [Solanum tuberosum]
MKKVNVKHENLDESIESSTTPNKEKNVSPIGYRNSSTLQVENEKLDHVTIKEEEETDMWISRIVVLEFSKPFKDPCYVTGYHEKRPLNILIFVGGTETNHIFIDESLANKLGYDSYPIKPRTINWAFGKRVTSRTCNNFQVTVQNALFNVKLYLLPLSSN